MSDDPSGSGGDGPEARAMAAEHLLAQIAARGEIALRLDSPGLDRLLRSIVDATVTLFDAEAASIALVESGGDLRFRVAAGERGDAIVGIVVRRGEGIAGFVAASGQPLAVSNVAADARFDREAAERTGYVPRSILAVPLQTDDRVIGVLEVLDRRGGAPFDLRDLTLAGVFARQAAIAIEVSRVDRDIARIVATALATLAGEPGTVGHEASALASIARAAVARIEPDSEPAFWALVDRLAALRPAEPSRLALVGDLVEAATRHLAPASIAHDAPDGRRLRSWRDRANMDD